MKKYAALLALAACGSDAPTVYFDTKHDTADTFWNAPWPSDTRLDANGAPDMTGFPNPRNVPILASLLSIVPERHGWPMMSIAYFRFTAPPMAVDGHVYLVDIEQKSTVPVVVQALPKDRYATSNLVAIAPVPGFVLRGNAKYAYVIDKEFAPGFDSPAGWKMSDALAAALPVKKSDVLVATEFTTGDEVARVKMRSDAIHTQYHPTIDNLALVGADTYDGFCRLSGTITMPQFQTGTEPFDTGGLFVLDANDVPQKQGDMTIPLTITLPKRAMPATGWPLYQFFHGSGGLSTGIVDLGPSLDSSDMPTPGKGPGYVVAQHGIAAASCAMPVNPERLVNATDYAYLNINNLSAFPHTFQQGVFEQRIFLDALLALHIPASALAGCTGISTPGSDYFFDATKLVAGGQSMGGMYTNMVGAIEPRFPALVPTGAGGYWNLMILDTKTIPGARELLATALGVDDTTLQFMHPAMDLMALAWEDAEPLVYMARLADRHIYEPVGKDDSYFQTNVYNAAALAYGNQEAGPAVWPEMQDSLALAHLDGLLTYPVKANEAGKTRVVVQYMGDGIVDPHYIYRQLDAVKHQYGCFLESYLRDGTPTVPAPGGLTDPCP
ncbi:MAG TPA: hypothetical protein VLT45_09015 [Kofleriaceae bacterium]|nr:hypothetical protein [Kofleriaceae bacterium]